MGERVELVNLSSGKAVTIIPDHCGGTYNTNTQLVPPVVGERGKFTLSRGKAVERGKFTLSKGKAVICRW